MKTMKADVFPILLSVAAFQDYARSVLTGRRARTGRAAEDVGPYHRSAPARGPRRW